MEKKILEEKLNKNLIQIISTFIPIVHYMKIIKYNKKLQEFNNISLYTYILNFIKNKFDINWLENNIDISFYLYQENLE